MKDAGVFDPLKENDHWKQRHGVLQITSSVVMAERKHSFLFTAFAQAETIENWTPDITQENVGKEEELLSTA